MGTIRNSNLLLTISITNKRANMLRWALSIHIHIYERLFVKVVPSPNTNATSSHTTTGFGSLASLFISHKLSPKKMFRVICFIYIYTYRVPDPAILGLSRSRRRRTWHGTKEREWKYISVRLYQLFRLYIPKISPSELSTMMEDTHGLLISTDTFCYDEQERESIHVIWICIYVTSSRGV